MAVHKLLDNATTDGVGLSMTNGGTLAVYALSYQGYLGTAYLDILVDFDGSGHWVTAGSLRPTRAAQLIMLPAGAKCNARLSGATSETKVTVVVAS